jgi:hypothetical protein
MDQYKALHEIIYTDELGRGRIDPNTVLTEAQVKALGDANVKALLKGRSLTAVKPKPVVAADEDGNAVAFDTASTDGADAADGPQDSFASSDKIGDGPGSGFLGLGKNK